MYREIVALRPDWHSDDNEAGTVKIVMTGSASDPQDWQPHVGTKGRRDLLAKRAKLDDDPSAPRFILNEPGVGYRFLD